MLIAGQSCKKVDGWNARAARLIEQKKRRQPRRPRLVVNRLNRKEKFRNVPDF